MTRRAKQTRSTPNETIKTRNGSALRPFWRPWAIVFAVAMLVRALHLWSIYDAPVFDLLMGDAKAYDEWGQRIAAGDWIGNDVFYQAPLYPYFLGVIYSIFGRSLLVVRVIHALLGASSAVLLGLAAQRLFSPLIGRIAGFALALYAPSIFFDSLMQKAVLDEFFICLMLWLSAALIQAPARVRPWFWLGIVTGGLSLTRENALVFVAVLAVWAAFPRSVSGMFSFSWRHPAAFALGLAVVLLPVVVRNNAVSGGFYLTTSQFGPNFFMGNNELADGTAMSLRAGRGTPEYERQDAVEIAERARGRSLTPAEVSSYWTERSVEFITTQPWAWTKLQLRKAALLVNATEILDTESQETYAEWSWPLRILGVVGHFGVLVPLALFGFIVAWPERLRLWPLNAMILAYAASVVIFYIYARYRYPLVPMLLIYAAVGIAALPDFIRVLLRRESDVANVGSGFSRTFTNPAEAGSHRTLFATSAAVLLAVLFTNWSMVSAEMNRTVTEHNLGAALQAEGRLDEAIEHYQRAIAISPDYAPAYSNLGTAQLAKGQVDTAIRSYEKALAIMPDFPDVHYNLANALLRANQPERAADHFAIAAKDLASSADVHNNLGNALMAQGKVAEAVAEFEKAVQFDPKSAKAERNLGNALAAAGRPKDALPHLLKATQLDPRDTSAWYDFGSLLLEGGLLPEAISAFRAALAIDPTMVDARNNLGIALGSAGYLDDAIAEFEAALRLQPGSEEARRNLEMTRRARAQSPPSPGR